MTPGAEHYLVTLFDMAARGYIHPSTWDLQEKASDRMFAYRNFDSCYDEELGLVIKLDWVNTQGHQPDFVEKALPWVAWLFARYAKGERSGRIIFVENGTNVTVEEMVKRFEPIYSAQD